MARSGRAASAGAFLLVAFTAVYVASLVLRHEPVYIPAWDLWIANLAMLVPALACFARAIAGGPRRGAAVWLGLGILSFTVGNVIYVGWTQHQSQPPVPSFADVGFLGTYPCIAAAVFCLARRDERSLTRSLWLDGALGAAGAATALAVVLSPVFSGLGGSLAETMVLAALPVGDLLLVAMIAGLLAVRGLRGGSMWLWLAGGLLLFCAADVVYALRVVADSYAVGSPVDALWACGLTVMALAIWRPERPRAVESIHSAAILAVPMSTTLTVLVVLVISSFAPLSPVVIGLAAVSLALAALRTAVSFRQVQRLSDARRQAVTDDLTGLGNRRRLFEHGAERLLYADRADRLALILIDLDNFKEVNDTLGHDTGDELLRETARRLAAHVGGPDLLVRLGGDEYALLMTLAAGENGPDAARRILEPLRRPLVIEGIQVRVDASAGVAVTGSERLSIAALLRRADVAMYAAKGARTRVELFHPRLDEANRTRLETVRDLDAAHAQNQFVLHYQPKIDLRTGTTVGVEALVRWQHPTRGLLYPDVFLPVLEQTGRMNALTRLVLDRAVQQIASWRATGLFVGVAVNLSASDLLDEDLPRRIAALLAEHAVPASALELEITESVLMTDPGRARDVLEGLSRLGLRIAVDDYGTGYSALAYLRDLPFDGLKIDRTFVARVTADRRSAAIVNSTVELAHALGLKVVAEGVEDQDVLSAVTGFGCDFAQGYHFSRPVPADAFADWFQLAGTPRVPVALSPMRR